MSAINEYFDGIFVVNLDSRPDKWRATVAEMRRHGIENYERFSAIAPQFQNIPRSYYDKIRPDKIRVKSYAVGVSGCKMSHVEIIKVAQQRNFENVLIFEDDILLEDHFEENFNLAAQELEGLHWDMLYLGANHQQPVTPVSPHVVQVSHSWTTHGYAISKSAYQFIIDNALHSGKNIDVFYCENLHPNYKCYCVEPRIATQRPGYSDILQCKTDNRNLLL